MPENQTTYLSCPVTGTPEPSIIWYRDDVPLFDSAHHHRVRQLDGARRLELRQVRRGDDDVVYKCQADNVAGQTVKRFTLKVLGMSRFLSLCFYFAKYRGGRVCVSVRSHMSTRQS